MLRDAHIGIWVLWHQIAGNSYRAYEHCRYIMGVRLRAATSYMRPSRVTNRRGELRKSQKFVQNDLLDSDIPFDNSLAIRIQFKIFDDSHLHKLSRNIRSRSSTFANHIHNDHV